MEDIAEKIFSKIDGAQLIQVRFVEITSENINYRMGLPFNSNRSFSEGVAVRIRANNAWGFAATNDLSETSILNTATQALKVAKSSTLAPRQKRVELAEEPVYNDVYSVRIDKDPFNMEFAEKANIVEEANKLSFTGADLVKDATASYNARNINQHLLSSDGNNIKQRILMIGANINAVAVGPEGPQNRDMDINVTGGWEKIEEFDFNTQAEVVRDESIALATKAKRCPKDFTGALILDPWQLGLQIHESTGHPTELDRVLGYEADFAGTSWMTPNHLNSLQYGNEMVNITQDPTIPGILGHLKYDDEGVLARPVPIVKEGIFVGYQSDREHASILGLNRSSGNSRADDYNDVPIIRMNSMNLEAPKDGFKNIDELIADTKDGIYGIRYKSHSIDDKRLNFQFSTQIGYRIENGEITDMLKNISYQGITPEFWNNLSGMTREYELHGHPNCGKGAPNMQIGYVTHGGPWSRFENVKMGIA
ncbi:MAG: TldD/PmbA family protein [Candidatus Heimdallarchaeota archaeon]|nr:TldD/PmbA family protein [Candidatus Heimdallarchaeota archaeon]